MHRLQTSQWSHGQLGIRNALIRRLLTELDSYQWFCSLDAAIGFWAVIMEG